MPGFVGRGGELALLEAALRDANAGRGRLLAVFGEPGIGKTRLADELCTRAGEGARVLWGRCWEAGGAPAFWPWIEILRPLIAEAEPAALAAQLGADAAAIATIVPELRTRLPGLPVEAAVESESARFLLFDSIARFLRARAASQTMILVLDDLHAADEPSLRLLQFVVRGLRGARLLIVATYRDADAKLVPQTAALLAAIERDGERVPLRRLGSEEVAQLIEAVSGQAPSREVVHAILRVTEGTPLYVNEVAGVVLAQGADALSASGARIMVPDGLGPAIRARLARVTDATRAILSAAAVIGRDFRVPVLEALLDDREAPGLDLMHSLAEAERAGLIADLHVEPAGFRFSHILVRETIYRDLGALGRERFHLRLARVLDAAVFRDSDGQRFAEIAHHFLRAGKDGRRDAARAARRAGEHALAILAHEQAVAHFNDALEALGSNGAEAQRERVELLLAKARAHQRGGDRAGLAGASEQAAADARQLGEWLLFADAALCRGSEFNFGVVDPTLVGLLEEALSRLPETEIGRRARVMARLASARQPAPNPDEPLALAQQAIALGRKAGDRHVLAAVLRDARAAYLPMDSLEQRITLDLETLTLAYETGDRVSALHAQRRLATDRLEEGEIAAALGHLDQCDVLAEQMREPHRKHWATVTRAATKLALGYFDDAWRLLDEAEARGGGRDAMTSKYIHFQRFGVIWAARRDAELPRVEEAIVRALSLDPHPMQHFFRAVVRCRMGDHAYVRAVWRDLTQAFHHPRFSGQELVAELAIAAGDRIAIEDIYERLVPWAMRFAGQLGFQGSFSRPLGQLAQALGRDEDARRHFEDAIAAEERIGARPWVAHSLVAYADFLRSTGKEADSARSDELLAHALAIAEELDMPAIVAMAREAAPPAAPSPREARPIDLSEAFKLEGEYWSVCYGGQAFRLKDNKGLQLVSYLIRNPDQDFHVLHLTGIADKTPGAPMLLEAGASAAADATARAAYKARLHELGEELEEAEARADVGRAALLREEIDALTDEITRGLGLGGRERGSGGSVERARVNVQRRISDALKKIEQACPALGRHLARSIRTGTYCSYASS